MSNFKNKKQAKDFQRLDFRAQPRALIHSANHQLKQPMHLVKTHRQLFQVLDCLRMHSVIVPRALVHFKMSQQSQQHFLVLVKQTKCSLRIDQVFSRNLHRALKILATYKIKIIVTTPIICQG